MEGPAQPDALPDWAKFYETFGHLESMEITSFTFPFGLVSLDVAYCVTNKCLYVANGIVQGLSKLHLQDGRCTETTQVEFQEFTLPRSIVPSVSQPHFPPLIPCCIVVQPSSGHIYMSTTNYTGVFKICPQAGSVMGVETDCLMKSPHGLAMDKDGSTLYVTDVGNHSIYAISLEQPHDGIIATTANVSKAVRIAGKGYHGYFDGPGQDAQFNNPQGIGIMSNGDVYVADSGNSCIRKVSKNDGAYYVETIAGKAGCQGFVDGVGLEAEFTLPSDIAINNGFGCIFISDSGNNRIRKLDLQTRLVTTYAGIDECSALDGEIEKATFFYPMGVCEDENGYLYVVDYFESIRRVGHGLVQTLTTTDNKIRADQSFFLGCPLAIASCKKNKRTYLIDKSRSSVWMVEHGKRSISCFAGIPENRWIDRYDYPIISYLHSHSTCPTIKDFLGHFTSFNGLHSIAVHPDNGDVFVADLECVRRIDPATRYVVTTIFMRTFGFKTFRGLAVHGNTIYVADIGVGCIYRFTIEEKHHHSTNDDGSGQMEPVTGRFTFLPCPYKHLSKGDAPGHSPGMALTLDGSTLYVVDTGNHRIQKVILWGPKRGQVCTVAGHGCGFVDGVGLDAQFNTPSAIAIGSDESLYIADEGNNRVRRITSHDGMVSTLATVFVDHDGVGHLSETPLVQPRGLSIGHEGFLNVLHHNDRFVNRIDIRAKEFSPLRRNVQLSIDIVPPLANERYSGTAAEKGREAEAAPILVEGRSLEGAGFIGVEEQVAEEICGPQAQDLEVMASDLESRRRELETREQDIEKWRHDVETMHRKVLKNGQDVETMARAVEKRENEVIAVALASRNRGIQIVVPIPPVYWNLASKPSDGWHVTEKIRAFDMDAVILSLINQSKLHVDGCGHSPSNRSSSFLSNIKSIAVHRIENPSLWKRYVQMKEEMISRRSCPAPVIEPPINPDQVLDQRVNEVYLWHGTRRNRLELVGSTRTTDEYVIPAERIEADGFDERIANRGLYGHGIYFTSQSCKAGQYSNDSISKRDGKHVLYYSRVLLGDCYTAKGPMNDLRRPPKRRWNVFKHMQNLFAGSGEPPLLYDSVVVNEGIDGHAGPGTQVHREFVIYNGRQAYPEYEVVIQH